jgi:hypothetical protein
MRFPRNFHRLLAENIGKLKFNLLHNNRQQLFLSFNRKIYFRDLQSFKNFCRIFVCRYKTVNYADVAQLIEQLICNHQVAGLSPIIGFNVYKAFSSLNTK